MRQAWRSINIEQIVYESVSNWMRIVRIHINKQYTPYPQPIQILYEIYQYPFGFFYAKVSSDKNKKTMNVKETVRRAWQLTQEHLSQLIWYGAIPAFFGVIVSSAYLAYQYNSLKNSAYFSGGAEQASLLDSLGVLWGMVDGHTGLLIVAIVLVVMIIAGNYLLPPVFKGTLIYSLMKLSKDEPKTGSLEIGIRYFFPIFEFAIITGAFSINTLFTESAFILRWWGESLLLFSLPILLFIAIAGLIISFLFTYTEYFIILEGKGLIRAIMDSSILVVSNLRKTILVFVLMLLIGARIILNVVLVLLVPMLVVFLTTYFATFFSSALGILLIVVVGLGILFISAYLLGLFQIFATAVWVLTFTELIANRPPKEALAHEGDES